MLFILALVAIGVVAGVAVGRIVYMLLIIVLAIVNVGG
jgi:hypothetical protein